MWTTPALLQRPSDLASVLRVPPPLSQALGCAWGSIVNLSDIGAPFFIHYYFFSNSQSCDLFLDWGNTPWLIIFVNLNLTQTLQYESFMPLSPDTQNADFSNSIKMFFFSSPNTAIALNFRSPFLN